SGNRDVVLARWYDAPARIRPGVEDDRVARLRLRDRELQRRDVLRHVDLGSRPRRRLGNPRAEDEQQQERRLPHAVQYTATAAPVPASVRIPAPLPVTPPTVTDAG